MSPVRLIGWSLAAIIFGVGVVVIGFAALFVVGVVRDLGL